MKKSNVLFVFALILPLVFISCSSNENSSSTTSTLLVGKWNYNKQSISPEGSIVDESDYKGNFAGCPKDYIEIKPGGVVSNGNYSGSTCLLTPTTGTWSQDGNTLIIFVPSVSLIGAFEIMSFTNTEMKLKTIYIQDEIKYTLTLSFIKA